MSDAAAVDAPAYGTQADFARAQGWERSYVTKLKHEGRLVFTAAGLVDFAASLQRIRASTTAPERAAPAVQGDAYAGAQDRDRFYTSELKRLEYERAIGKLLDAEQVGAAISDAAAIFRSALEAWEHTLPAQLASLNGDETRISALLRDEAEQLLRRVSEAFARHAHGDDA